MCFSVLFFIVTLDGVCVLIGCISSRIVGLVVFALVYFVVSCACCLFGGRGFSVFVASDVHRRRPRCGGVVVTVVVTVAGRCCWALGGGVVVTVVVTGAHKNSWEPVGAVVVTDDVLCW